LNAQEQLGQMVRSLKTNEWLLVAGAAWIFVVDYIIGNRIDYEYSSTALIIVAPLSAVLLLAVWAKHGSTDSAWSPLLPGLTTVAAILIVTFVGLDLLNGLFNDFTSHGEFYEITLYLAGAAVLAGLVLPEQSSSD
jgi:hypothetical protein